MIEAIDGCFVETWPPGVTLITNRAFFLINSFYIDIETTHQRKKLGLEALSCAKKGVPF